MVSSHQNPIGFHRFPIQSRVASALCEAAGVTGVWRTAEERSTASARKRMASGGPMRSSGPMGLKHDTQVIRIIESLRHVSASFFGRGWDELNLN